MSTSEKEMRRNIPTRSKAWSAALAHRLQRMGATPNAISALSVVFAAIGCTAFLFGGFGNAAARPIWLLVAACCIPLRLLCNMLDGMLAVEGGMQSPVGDLYNELPDRISDVLFIAGAGYAARDVAWASDLGWIAASLAVLTAYVRTLGASQGLSNHFAGPMAKPQRMHVLIGATILSIFETRFPWESGTIFVVALFVIAIGSAITVVVRLNRIVADLRAGASR